MNYAFIEEGVVVNLIWLDPANESNFPNAVACKNYPVWIGDTYDGENFYRDGEKLKTQSEIMSEELKDATNALRVLGVIDDE